MLQILPVLLVWLVGLVSPGPDFTLNISQSLHKGRKSGLATSLGFGAGVLIHCVYCLVGLGIIISQSIILFSVLKIVGGAYLIYLGLASILNTNISKNSKFKQAINQKETLYQSFKVGFLTDVLNPKTTILILGLFAQLIEYKIDLSVQILFTFGLVISTILWHSFVSLAFSTKYIRFKYNSFKSAISQVFGLILIGFGCVLILIR